LLPDENIVGRWRVISYENGSADSSWSMSAYGENFLAQVADDGFYDFADGEFLLAIWEFLPNGEFRKHLPSFLGIPWEMPYSTGTWKYTGEDESGRQQFDLYFKLVHYQENYTTPNLFLHDNVLRLEEIDEGGHFILGFEREVPASDMQDIVGVWEVYTLTFEGETVLARDYMDFLDGLPWSWSIVFLPDGRIIHPGNFGGPGQWVETGRNTDGNQTFEVVDDYEGRTEMGLSFFELRQNGELVMTNELHQEDGFDFFTFRRDW